MRHCITYGLFCEDSEEEIIRRIDRIAAFYGRTRADFTGFYWASLFGVFDTEFINFDSGRARQTDPFRLFESQVQEYRAEFAVIDTIADFYGGSEIDRRQVSQFLRMMTGCCFRQKCTILGSRHPSQSGQRSGSYTSGSTGWEAKERSRLVLRDPVYDEDEDDDRKQRQKFREPSNKRILTRAACNYALPGIEIDLSFEDGAFQAVGIDPAAVPRHGQIRDLASDAKFLELLRKIRQQGRYVHDAPNNPARYAPAVFAKHPDRGDFTLAEFKRAMDRAFSAGRIMIPPGRRSEIVEKQ